MNHTQSIFRPRQTKKYDVLVIGGGLAGLCAALAAARQGADVAIIHNRPVFGGNSSSEIRVPPAGAVMHNPYGRETGIIHELMLEDRARNHMTVGTGHANAVWDMVLYDAVRQQKNLEVFFNTNIHHVKRDGARMISVMGDQLGSEIQWEILGKLFIDASGDGVVGTAAGVPFRVGQESRDEYGESFAPTQQWAHSLGSSLHFRALDTRKPAPFVAPDWAIKYPTEDSLKYRSHHGDFDSGYWWIEVGFPYDTIDDNEKLRDVILAHVLGVWDHIKNHCELKDRAVNFALDWIGMVPGKRESRRFIGDHVLTQQDIQARKLFDDRVGFGGWEIDDHTKQGITDVNQKPSFNGVNHRLYFLTPYSVPLSCMTTSKIENLIFAGRVLSASRLAFNSLRVMKTLAALGEAAGVAAATIAHHDNPSTQMFKEYIEPIQQTLLRSGVYIPRLGNMDQLDQAPKATITASSRSPLSMQPDDSGLVLDQPLAQLIPVGDAGVTQVRTWLANRSSQAVAISAALIPAVDIWDLSSLPNDLKQQPIELNACVQADYQGWVTWELPSDVALKKGLYWLMLRPVGNELTWCYANPIPHGLTAARFKMERWWFAPDAYVPWQTMAIQVDPDPDYYAPENIISGVTRPEGGSNLWQSDPAQPLPQWIELRWDKFIKISRVELTFNTHLNLAARDSGTLHKAAQCIRDMRIVDHDGCELAVMTGNYQRQRQFNLPGICTDCLRFEMLATQGDPRASIYEVRVYS